MEAVFLTELEKEYSELIETGKIQIVEEVKRLTSKRFFYSNPIYFSGNIRSKIAIVKFNAKNGYFYRGERPKNFSQYRNRCQNLGKFFLETEGTDELKLNFSSDIRIINYLKPFQIIRFSDNSLQKNLQKLTDEKFELDLVPYLSPDFSVHDFLSNYDACKPFVERILKGILAYPRQYVVFMGDYFGEILGEYIEESERFTFLLTSPNRPNQKFMASFVRIILNFNNRKVIAGIAESFYDESLDEIMLDKYGRESVAIINQGLSEPTLRMVNT